MIEMVVAMAIAAIILTIIMLLIRGTSNSFEHTSNEVNLQMEAQTTMNQLTNQAMEAVELQPEITWDEKRYTFRYVRHDSENREYEEYITIVYDIETKKLFQITVTDFEEGKSIVPIMKDNFLADYIEDLVITLNPNGKSLTIHLKLSLGRDEYEMSKKVKLRNKN